MIRDPRPRTPATRVDQPGREVPVVPDGEHPAEQERPEDWGWHAEMGKWGRRLWPIPFAVILAYLLYYWLTPHHEDRQSDLWLAGILVVMLLVVFRDWRRRRNAWRSK